MHHTKGEHKTLKLPRITVRKRGGRREHTWVCLKKSKPYDSNLIDRMCQSCQQRSTIADLNPRVWTMEAMIEAKETPQQDLTRPTLELWILSSI